jgi:DNA-binding transcriptional LysR family regulator
MPHPSLRRYFRHGLLPQLLVFEAVSRLENVTRAAEELHLAQSTVSTQLKKLSNALDTGLFEKHGKRWRLTQGGELVAAASRELHDLLARLEARLSAIRGGKPGVLRIASAPGGRHLAARLLAAFCVRHPGVQAGLHVGGVDEIVARLMSGEDELCVLPAARHSASLETHAIVSESLYIYGSVQHKLASARAITSEMLGAEALVLREPGSALREALVQACAKDVRALTVRAEFASNAAIAEAVASGLGLGLLPESEAQYWVRIGAMVALDVRGFPLLREWTLARARGKYG